MFGLNHICISLPTLTENDDMMSLYKKDKKISNEVMLTLQDLFVEYYPALKSFAVRYVNSPEVAEDLVQDVFLRLWENGELLDDVEEKSAYLYQMVRFKAIDYLRHKKYSEKSVEEYAAELSQVDDSAYWEEEIYRRMMIAIDKLPKGVHSVLTLTLEGRSAKEVAEQLNISVETVKKQKQIARKMLRDKLLSLLLLLLN